MSPSFDEMGLRGKWERLLRTLLIDIRSGDLVLLILRRNFIKLSRIMSDEIELQDDPHAGGRNSTSAWAKTCMIKNN